MRDEVDGLVMREMVGRWRKKLLGCSSLARADLTGCARHRAEAQSARSNVSERVSIAAAKNSHRHVGDSHPLSPGLGGTRIQVPFCPPHMHSTALSVLMYLNRGPGENIITYQQGGHMIYVVNRFAA